MSPEERDIMILQRKLLLSHLSTFYPSALPGDTLFRACLGVFPEYTRHRCFRDLAYLREKGYVTVKRPGQRCSASEGEWRSAHWAATAAGMDVAQAINTDPTLEV